MISKPQLRGRDEILKTEENEFGNLVSRPTWGLLKNEEVPIPGAGL